VTIIADRHGHTGDLPLRSILAPKTNAILLLGDAQSLVKLDDTDAEVPSPLSNLCVCLPNEVAPGLRNTVVWALAQTSLVGILLRCDGEDVVSSSDCWIEGLEERPVAETPVTVDSRAALDFRARDRN
jgi:hypothetical protein